MSATHASATHASPAAQDTADRYGVRYSGVLVDGSYHEQVDHSAAMTLAEVAKAKGTITRIRVLAEKRGRWFGDISYVHATLPSGKIVPVLDHPGQISNMAARRGEMIEWAKEAKVFAKGLGLLDDSAWSIMWG